MPCVELTTIGGWAKRRPVSHPSFRRKSPSAVAAHAGRFARAIWFCVNIICRRAEIQASWTWKNAIDEAPRDREKANLLRGAPGVLALGTRVARKMRTARTWFAQQSAMTDA